MSCQFYPAVSGQGCAGTDRGCKGPLCRLQKEQRHAKTIALRFQQPYLASLPPSTCTQRCTVVSKSSPSCPAGSSCAPHSFLPWAGQVCAGATAPTQRWKPRSEHWQVGAVQERTTLGCRELTGTKTAKVVYFFRHPLTLIQISSCFIHRTTEASKTN